jgi:hypothetical protein
MEKGKRKGFSLLAGLKGISAQLSAGARACARAGGPASPRKGGTVRANAVGTGPRVTVRRGRVTTSGGRGGPRR